MSLAQQSLIPKKENIQREEVNENAQIVMTFAEYKDKNISRSLNADNEDKCCDCDWNYCLSETW